MNLNPTLFSNIYRPVKSEPDHENVDRFKTDLLQQKEDYERRIVDMQKAHEEQICKLCSELEKSSAVLHQYKLELDSMRSALNQKEKQVKNGVASNQHSSSESLGLVEENAKLKKDLSMLTTKYESVASEMQDAREYILKMIASLD